MAWPPLQAERQSRSPGKPRPLRVAAKCGACFVALLGIVAQTTTFVARLAFIRILAATQSAWDLFRGSLGSAQSDPNYCFDSGGLVLRAERSSIGTGKTMVELL